ncbi:MAG: hypothetical protein U9Q82_05480, partial [Chloroflexota bacterium]|nr:hypothetical protein [Chloroflexota bacterium]
MNTKSFLVFIILIIIVGGWLALASGNKELLQTISLPRPTLDKKANKNEIQVYLNAVQAEGTLEVARAQMTATQQVINATATAQQAALNATAKAEQASLDATLTQQARNDQATVTERAWQAEQATRDADRSNATNTARVADIYATGTAEVQATQD